MKPLIVPFALASCVLAVPAGAVTIIGDEATFQATAGATAEAPIPNLGPQGGPTTVGNLTFSVHFGATDYFLGGGAGPEWSTLIAGNDIAVSGPEHLRIQSAHDMTAIGFFFHQPTAAGPGSTDTCNAPCFDSLFDFQFNRGGVLVDIVAGFAPGPGLSYLGFDVGAAFDEVLIFDITGTIDNEFFGGFSTAAATAAVPLAPMLPAALAGLLTLGWAGRRRGSDKIS